MNKLMSFFFRYSPSLIIIAMIASVVTGACNTALVALINEAIADIGNTNQALIWSFAALCLLLPVTRVVSQVLLVYLVQKAVYDLRMMLSRQILSAPLRKLEEIGPNKLLTSLTDDVTMISTTLGNIPALVMHGSIVLTCVGYLVYLSWQAGLAVMVAIVIGVVMFRLVVGRAQYYANMARSEQDNLFKHFRALTDGIKELKQHRPRKKAFTDEILHLTGSAFRRNNLAASGYFAGAGSLGQLLFFAVIGLLIFMLPVMVAGITPQILTGYALVLLYLVVPLEGLTSLVPGLVTAVIALERVEGLGVTLKKFSLEQEPPMRDEDWHLIELDEVTHTYHREKEDRTFTMGPISLSFEPGELTFLIGGNGSGKTTLAKMILGLYQPESGQIRLDGEEITDQNRDTYRQIFTGVFSDFFLFDTMLGIGAAEVDDKVRSYLKRLQIDHKVKIENGALNTLDLSQGQRKRLALLTAYMEDRPVYLFDEWAADQDPIFKEIFYLHLLPELKARGKTIIVISHDDHYYHIADRIIKLEYGQLEHDRVTANS